MKKILVLITLLTIQLLAVTTADENKKDIIWYVEDTLNIYEYNLTSQSGQIKYEHSNIMGDIAVSPSGEIYTVDLANNGAVTKYDASGSQSDIGTFEINNLPNALSFDENNYMYVGYGDGGSYYQVKDINNLTSHTVWFDPNELFSEDDSVGSSGDVIFMNGKAYASVNNSTQDKDYLIELTLGEDNIVVSKKIFGRLPNNSFGLASDGFGTLYAGAGDTIYELDISDDSSASEDYTIPTTTAATIENNIYGLSGFNESLGNVVEENNSFICDGTMYFSNEAPLGTADETTTGSMYLHSINTEKSPFSFTQIGSSYVNTYNALAYNPKDNFLYATYGDSLLKIDKDGDVEDLGVISGLTTNQKYSATFDKDGYYYLGDWQDRTKIYKIDISTKTIVETMELSSPLFFIDMTISDDGSNKYLYLFNRSASSSEEMANQLVKVNITQTNLSGKYDFETIGDQIEDEEEADSIFYDAADKLYVLLHKGGFYQVDTTTGKRIPISSVPELANLNDGAICPNGTIELKPTLSIGDATVIEGDSDTTELIFPVTLINNDDPKSLTFSYQVYDGNSTDTLDNAIGDEDFVKQDYSITVTQEAAHDSEIKVVVNGDTNIEKDELIQLLLQEVTGALFLDTKTEGTILNDDDVNSFTAYDSGDVNRKIRTKKVGEVFTLTLALVDSSGELVDSIDENSTQVRIVDSATCSTAFDGDMSDFTPFSMDGSSTQTSPVFKSALAMKYAKIQFYWQDALGEHTSCSLDTFAIRPDRFIINVPATITAGEDFDITVEAMSADNVHVVNYEESQSVYTLDINDTKAVSGCALGNFTKKIKSDFVGGISTVTLNYENVGTLKFQAIEVQTANTEYANIDKDDGSDITRFIATGASEKFIDPASIQALFTFNTQNSQSYTYFSDTPRDMGVLIDANITLLNANNVKVSNFNDSCWASDVSITIDYSQEQGLPAVASFSDDATANLGNIIVSDKVTYAITKDKFSDGNALKRLYLNFDRDIKIPKAPIQIKLSSPTVSLSSGLNTSVASEKLYTFVYARANSAPEQSVVGDTINAKIDYEVYIPDGIDRTIFGLDGLSLSDNGGTWYKLPTDTVFGYQSGPTLRYSSGAYIVSYDKDLITVKVSKTPHANRVVYYPKEYLLFNKFNNSITSHSFKINLYSGVQQWSGKGNFGAIVDKDVSKNVVQKMNW